MAIPTLRTARLELRPYALADASWVQEFAGSPEIAATTVNIPHPYLDGVAEKWIGTHAAAWEAGTEVTWAITEGGELRGSLHLVINARHRRAEAGYWIARPQWGRGLATEALREGVRFSFTELDLNRVAATHLARNVASGRVMEKAGLNRESVIRDYFVKNGKFEDIVQYALLKREWSHG